MGSHPSNWTSEREAELIRLWGDNLSARQCAAKLGNISRNGVIGRVRRLIEAGKMPRRAVKITHAKAVRPIFVAKAVRPIFVAKPKPLAPVVAEPEPLLLTLMELSDKACRWPIGDVGPDLRFCGCMPKEGSPYCEAHARKAYQPQQLRRAAGAAK